MRTGKRTTNDECREEDEDSRDEERTTIILIIPRVVFELHARPKRTMFTDFGVLAHFKNSTNEHEHIDVDDAGEDPTQYSVIDHCGVTCCQS